MQDVELEADYGKNYNSEVIKHLVQLAPPYPTHGNATEMLQESVSARYEIPLLGCSTNSLLRHDEFPHAVFHCKSECLPKAVSNVH